MCIEFELVRYKFKQFFFYHEHVFAGRDTGAIGDPENMRIDRDRGVTESDV